MTVEELIIKLKDQDPAAVVHFVYDYGDHWHTKVAPEVKCVTDGYVRDSDYHNMPKMVDPEEDETADEDRSVVLLKVSCF